MKNGLKILGGLLGGLFAFVILVSSAFSIYALKGWKKTWDTPLPKSRASQDTNLISRGRYLVYGPAHCADCHSPDSVRERMFRGEEVPLTGGPGERTFLGTWSAPNLTPDSATGLGNVSDGQLARMLRHGVNREGRIGLPFMDAYADLTEQDLIAIMSFLRSLPPEPGVAPLPKVNLLGKITVAYFLKPYAPKAQPPESLMAGSTVEYGEYMANTVCGCRACHTARNLKTGEYLSPFYAGGLPFHSRLKPGFVYVSPNLTPDSLTGHIYSWTEEAFVKRFQSGLTIADDPMPWGSLMRMREEDIKALYRYLKSLAPVQRDNGPMFQPENGKAAAGG